MATSAFKSTSRRGAPEPPPPSRRRSHSVSAVNRKTDDILTEFSNSRENPLFWTASSSLSSPRDKENDVKTSEIGSNSSKQLNLSTRRSGGGNSVGRCDSVGEERGRSVTRNGGAKKGIGRSLSRARSYDESEKEQDVVTSTGARSRTETKQIGNGVNRSNSIRSRIDTRGGRAEEARIRKFQNQAKEWSEDDSTCSFQISNLEDEVSIDDLSEAEEKTIKAVCEDLTPSREQLAGDVAPSGIYESARSEAFQRNNVHTVTATNIADIPVDLVNLEDMELISDIRKEYAMKLEQSEERARRLRTDLAVEEHRGQELGRILKEIIPDPKTSIAQKPRRGRRTSNERKRMSKRLTEEAMAYFDECVSLSTFDSSDFSAPEDPTFSSSGATMHVGASSLVKGSPNTLRSYDQDNTLHQKQVQLHHSYEDSGTKINNTAGARMSYNFSFSNQQSKTVEPHENFINSYIKNFERDIVEDTDSDCRSSYYDAEEYSAHEYVENMLIDRVLYRNRIESGSLLLCSGGISFLPFSSDL